MARSPVDGSSTKTTVSTETSWTPYRWLRDGTWARILTGLQARADAAGLITWDVSVDSTIARAHQHAAGARKKGICRPNHPAGMAGSSRPNTRWGARGADRE